MQPKKQLSFAISAALGLTTSFVVSNVALAQDQQSDENSDTTLEEVIVTGSRIKRANLESANPVTVVDRAQMEVTGLTDVGDLLQSIPSMSGSPIGTTTNNGGNGAVYVDLRGMGSQRTVTLVNGHRMVDSGDFQTIPSTMIERVEILKNGASAIYGADAVAGVVNIITRRDFDGLEVSVEHNEWDNTSGGEQNSASLIGGKEFDGGNFVFGAEFVQQHSVLQQDTPWAFLQDSYYIYPEGCEHQVAAPYDGTPTGGCYPIGSSRIPEGRFNFVNQGAYVIGSPASQPGGVGMLAPDDGRNYNYAPVNFLQTPYKRVNVFSEAHFQLTDNVRFNAEIRGNYRESEQQLAPMPYDTLVGLDPGYPFTYNGSSYQGVSGQNYYLRRAIDAYNAANGTSLAYEPVQRLRRRMIEAPRTFNQKIYQFQFVTGLEGKFHDVDWDMFLNQGYRGRQDSDHGQLLGDRLAKALGPSADLNGDGVPECYGDINDPSTLIAGCVPLNMFGGGDVVRATGEPTVTSITPEMLNYVSATLNDHFSTKQTLGGINFTGDLFDLPGGALGWAAGYTYWRQEYQSDPDSGKASFTVTGNKYKPTSGSLTSNSYYVEVLAPVYDNGTQKINLQGSWRYDDYNAFSGDDTYQLGAEIQVVDSLKFRGTYSTVFRAPTITDLYSGVYDSFPTFTDPCAPDAQGNIAQYCAQPALQPDNQVLSKKGGNPNLTPEKGDTTTFGVVWTPQFGDHNFTATVDYFKIKLNHAISNLGVQFILEDCYERNVQASCALVTRATDATYQALQILDVPLNVAKQGAEGYDTELTWSYDASFGQLNADLLWSHLLHRTKTPYDGAEENDLAGRYTDPTQQDGGAYPEDKANFTLRWAYNDFSVSYLAEYIGSLNADTFCNCGAGNQPDGTYIQSISSQMYHDIAATYTLNLMGTNTTIAAGITNIGDKAPPYIEEGFNATTAPTVYRLFGRGYYLRLRWKF